MTIVEKNSSCRVCRGTKLRQVFSLGSQPLANRFLCKEDLDETEPVFPLEVFFCTDCALLQLLVAVSPDVLFRNYVYASSTSPSFVDHFHSFAADVCKRFDLKPGALVVDIGSNDGILLKPFKELGKSVLGVDPAVNITELAEQSGIETLPYFYNLVLAREIVETRGRASIVTATNVFAHVNNLDQFLEATDHLLDEEGVFIIEVPYLVDFIEKCLFDTVYHEHLSYFSIRPLKILFERLKMEIFDVQRVPSHGGSVRVFVKRVQSKYSVQDSVESLLANEGELGLYSLSTFNEFADQILESKRSLLEMLGSLVSRGKRIVGYGAPAKSSTLLNFYKLGTETLDYIVDDSTLKQGLLTPGTHIPVVGPNRIHADRPDYVLILAWNFADSIMEKLVQFRDRGGKFIVPVPRPYIV